MNSSAKCCCRNGFDSSSYFQFLKSFCQNFLQAHPIIILILWQFFTSMLVNDFSLKFEWQQVFSSFQDSSQYTWRSVVWMAPTYPPTSSLPVPLPILWGLCQVYRPQLVSRSPSCSIGFIIIIIIIIIASFFSFTPVVTDRFQRNPIHFRF